MNRALMIGRFQPFHNGHVALARQALADCDELVIVVGSAQYNFIEKDPFTAGERILMIHDALAEAGIDLTKCYIIPVPNDDNNARWLANLRSMVPHFNTLYSGNEFVDHLAFSQDPSLVVRQPEFSKKQEYNGTNIRRLMAELKSWEPLVPAAVARIIKQIDGISRIRMLAKSDSKPQEW
ncbi:MAG: nicotinamide-nucleotide adenylyltransferase [Nitrososphaera sp.]|nr:nicotinamide-nucleotide adenylyltransferase [Nitrososphaera sp.]